MKSLHLLAAGCFITAIILYILGSAISIGLAILGALFESIAWTLWLGIDKKGTSKDN
jgi:hypothetical protein